MEQQLREMMRMEQEQERAKKNRKQELKVLQEMLQEKEKKERRKNELNDTLCKLKADNEKQENLQISKKQFQEIKAKLEAYNKYWKEILDELSEFAARKFAPFNCPICDDMCPIDDQFIIEPCNHIYCRSCIRDQVLNAISEMTGQVLCSGCSFDKRDTPTIISQIQVFSVLQPEEQNKYLSQEFKLYVSKDPCTFTCPKPDCKGVIEIPPNSTHFICPIIECKFSMCHKCKVSWHADKTCEEYQSSRKKNEEDLDKRMIEEMIAKGLLKRCPKCSNGVEKTEGCNHMTCQCGTHYCNVCAEILSPKDPYKHFNQAGGKCVFIEFEE